MRGSSVGCQNLQRISTIGVCVRHSSILAFWHSSSLTCERCWLEFHLVFLLSNADEDGSFGPKMKFQNRWHSPMWWWWRWWWRRWWPRLGIRAVFLFLFLRERRCYVSRFSRALLNIRWCAWNASRQVNLGSDAPKTLDRVRWSLLSLSFSFTLSILHYPAIRPVPISIQFLTIRHL